MRLVVGADGASRGNPGPASYGAVVLDAATGEVLAERAAYIGTATNNVAEYRGLIAGLEAARELDPRASVEVRMDSKLVVEQMSGRWKVRHPDMAPLALAARAVLPPEQVSYAWVPREQNRHADRLANEALDAAARGEAWVPTMGRVTPDEEIVDEAEVGPVPQPALVGWADDLGAATTFVLLRHAETSFTVDKLFSGSRREPGPGLTEHGRWQARQAAAVLAARRTVEAIVTSPLRRARETAETVAAALHLEVRVDDGYRECDFGEWDGATLAEVRQRWPVELAAWLAAPSVAPPGGESFDAVGERVRLARDKTIARYPGRTVLVVTHVTPVKQLVRAALQAPPAALYRMELQPASFTAVQWYAPGTASLRLFNDTSHLRDDGGHAA